MVSSHVASLARADRLDPPPESLAEQLLDALAHVHDHAYLEDHPIAHLVPPDAGAGRRDAALGRAVQRYLLDSLEDLRGAAGTSGIRAHRGYRLLTMRYVEGLDAPSVQAKLAIGKSEYYRDRQRAVEALASLLRGRLRSEDASSDGDSAAVPKIPSGPRLPADRLPSSRPRTERSGPSSGPAAGGVSAWPSLTSLVGRERELAEVEALVGDTRLLTLVGMGGVGKTRLALAVADRLARAYPDGVWLVELAPLADAGLLSHAVASALGLSDESGQATDVALERHLWPRRLLLVLDNCEHLLDGCAELADRLLRRCPRLQILATSREALRIGGETRWRVPSLGTPPRESWLDFEAVAGSEAVRLFVERARSADPSFALGPANAASVAEICWRLDGLPLALELAAARVASLGVDAIARHLDDALSLLTDGSRTAMPRQQTLRATVDWSHGLLGPQERAVFRRLAALADATSLETVEGVCRGGEVEAREVPAILGKLVDRSLVQVEQVAGETRYRLPEVIRQYASERLEEAGESDREQ